MDISEILSIALPVVYVIVGAVLVWLVIELVMTVRKTRKTVDDLQKQVEPTLASVERITASLEPVAAKVDPLVERVSLTVDAANLEIMRVDQILEDVNEITDSVASAVEAVDTVTNAPVELVNNVTSRVRNAFKSRRASDESVASARRKPSAPPPMVRTETHRSARSTADVVKGVVTTSVAAAKEAVADQREQRAEQRAERDEKAEAKRVAADKSPKSPPPWPMPWLPPRTPMPQLRSSTSRTTQTKKRTRASNDSIHGTKGRLGGDSQLRSDENRQSEAKLSHSLDDRGRHSAHGRLVYLFNILSVPIGIVIWSIVIVFCLRGPVNKLEKLGVPRVAGTTIAYVLMFVVLALVGLLMFSPAFGVGDQFTNLIESIPATFRPSPGGATTCTRATPTCFRTTRYKRGSTMRWTPSSHGLRRSPAIAPTAWSPSGRVWSTRSLRSGLRWWWLSGSSWSFRSLDANACASSTRSATRIWKCCTSRSRASWAATSRARFCSAPSSAWAASFCSAPSASRTTRRSAASPAC